MATTPSAKTAPTTTYLKISVRVQQVCRDHALWANGQPRNALAVVLTGAVAWPKDPHTGCIIYECRSSQVDALLLLLAALRTAMRAAGCSQSDGATVSQWQRRILENRAKDRPPPIFGAPVGPHGVDLFGATPASAKARQMYEQHVMKSLRELVDFSQSSAY